MPKTWRPGVVLNVWRYVTLWVAQNLITVDPQKNPMEKMKV